MKIETFRWRLILDRIPTTVNLQRRGIVYSNEFLNFWFCKMSIENYAHLFIYCNFSYVVWMYMYNWLGVQTTLARNVWDLFSQHDRLRFCKGPKRIGRMFWFAVLWTIWLHRNDMIFNQSSLDFDRGIELIKFRVWSWCQGLVKKANFSYTDWISNPLYFMESAL